ncbi:DsbA family protein [Maridesulfovibrio hydrothermalis]|uniref:DSBA oxidoreductase n=1 Tax=Maridesulfovibrio hydrothermalis AM13 = DSM 14728 TaxID=1121451 RepID=L0RCK5_9BACT|nr:thioredoxin domain-containing protein [Maridesulfovibrio hydrothermalis]CCO24479.1 DSBA oxidoreductase [Maridesulfovibrio hydrothermalis AM13 = DSM 14728]
MVRNTILFLAVVFFSTGCMSKQMLKEQITETLRDNPQIVLEAMRENSMDVLAIVESGIDVRDEMKRQAKFEAEINNPFNPKIWSERISLGSKDAPVTIVEYTDFLCPYCSKGAKVVKNLVTSNPEKYRLVFKHLPLHEESRELAVVFEALSLLDKDLAFKFHDLAFARQKELFQDKNGIVLGQILQEIDVDLEMLQEKLQSAQVQTYLLSDEKEAREFGLDATPTFLINGVSIRGYLPADKFENMVGLILEKSPKVLEEEGEICEDCLNQQ